MKYGSIGKDTSASEVTDISPFGIWILHRGKEYFLAYEDFPWFKEAPISKVFTVIDEGPDHLRWPALDVDLSIKSIRNPGTYPLVYEPKASYGKQDVSPDPDKPGS